MRKLKNALILLLTMGLIGLGAVLPGIVAAVMDRETMHQSGAQDITPVTLDVNGEPRSLSAAGKIALLRTGRTIAITEREASMTQAEVNAKLEAAMAAYVDAGAFEWFDYTSWVTQPYLCVDLEEPDKYSVFWTVTVVNENEPFQTLLADIDDETGRIFSIRFDRYGEYSLDGVWERNAATMDAVAHIFLNQLGFMEDPQNMGPNMAYYELDGEVLCGTFLTKEEDYGEICIEFYVTGTGSFWVYFPE